MRFSQMIPSTHASMTMSISLTMAVAMTVTTLMIIHLLSYLVSLFVVLSIKFVTCIAECVQLTEHYSIPGIFVNHASVLLVCKNS